MVCPGEETIGTVPQNDLSGPRVAGSQDSECFGKYVACLRALTVGRVPTSLRRGAIKPRPCRGRWQACGFCLLSLTFRGESRRIPAVPRCTDVKSALAQNTKGRPSSNTPLNDRPRFAGIDEVAEWLKEAAGKHKRLVIGAVMRKLLVLAFGILRSGVPFDANYA